MLETYILEGKTPVRVDMDTWGEWLHDANRILSKTDIGKVQVSTVFVGVNQVFFETMIFGGKYNGYQRRCSTWDEAEMKHAEAVAMVRGS